MDKDNLKEDLAKYIREFPTQVIQDLLWEVERENFQKDVEPLGKILSELMEKGYHPYIIQEYIEIIFDQKSVFGKIYDAYGPITRDDN